MKPHRFFLDYMFGGGQVREVAPPPWREELPAEVRYPFDVIERALPLIQSEGLHFYFTKEAYRLPEYGAHVVAVLLQEERCKPAVYGRHVRATLRNTSIEPFLGYGAHRRMGRLEAVLTFEYARDWFTHTKAVRAAAAPKAGWPELVRARPVTVLLPLGYHSQRDVPQVPMAQRSLDTFFSGDIKSDLPKTDYRYWTSTSKSVSRAQLWRSLSDLQRSGEWRIDLANLGSTQHLSQAERFNAYSEKMMNSRICVSPRGTLADTYRSHEGLRAGCLVVAQRVPRDSFLHDAPIMVIDHWSQFAGILQRYGRDLDFLEAARARSLEYWQAQLQPAVFAPKVAAALDG